jgi:hypothetical protein
MKLVKPHVIEDVEKAIVPAIWKKIVMGPEWTIKHTEWVKIPEVVDYPVIEFDSPIAIGIKIDVVDLGDIVYHGVIPTRHIDNSPNKATCQFDLFIVKGN